MLTPLNHNLCPLQARCSAVFSPKSLPGLTLWLKSDAITGLGDGDPVTTWLDSSGNGNTATGVGASRPTYRTGIVAGKPVLRFDGAGDRLALPNLLAGATSATALFVCKLASDPPATAARTGPPVGNFGSNGVAADHYPYLDGAVYHDFGSTVRQTLGNPGDSLASWHVCAFRSAPGDWGAWINGALLFTTATNTVGFGAAPLVGGTEGAGGPYHFDGDLAEVVLYDAALTDANRRRVEQYLGAKYGISVV